MFKVVYPRFGGISAETMAESEVLRCDISDCEKMKFSENLGQESITIREI